MEARNLDVAQMPFWQAVPIVVVALVVIAFAVVVFVFVGAFAGIFLAVTSRWFWCVVAAVAGAYWLNSL